VFDQGLGLRVGQILTRDKDMLIKRHASFLFSGAFHRADG
jgi:hypothetical protein